MRKRERERERGGGGRERVVKGTWQDPICIMLLSLRFREFIVILGKRAVGWLLDGYSAVDLCEWVSWGVCMGWAG